ncbi:MAG: ArsR family transcriptional regulator [ANME-2 cluster archaeon]|nr:ArsR family transcriptional regulator [ANME-2 cluster archaeon]
MGSKKERTIIFSTEKGMVALNSPVKLIILQFIGNRSRTFEEIVSATHKAKSTISVHLKDLIEQNLILEHRDSTDKRKKIFFLNSQFIAYSQAPIQKNYDLILDRLIHSVDEEIEFFKTLCHTIRYGLEAYGLNPRPVMKKIGYDIGKRLSVLFVSDSIEDLLFQIADFWKSHDLGVVEVSGLDQPAILVHECFDCSDMPDVGRTLCALDEGLLEGIFQSRLNKSISVEELECFGTGYDHCKFNIQILD